MFECILHQHLDGAWNHIAGQAGLRNICIDLEPGGEAHLEEVCIHFSEFQFFTQTYKRKCVILKHIPEDAGELVHEQARFLVLVFADKTVEDIQRIEQEMRVHLLLEFQVFKLGLVAFRLFCSHVLMRNTHIVSHIDQCVEQHFGDEYHDGGFSQVVSRRQRLYGERKPYADSKSRTCDGQDQE